MNVLIAGAGIGGLTLAAALQREGISVRIVERAPELKSAGSGITVQINAMRALAHYGFAEKMLSTGAQLHETVLCDWKGRQITRGSLAEFSTRHGQPMLCAHRTRLHEALRSFVAPGALTLGREVRTYREGDDGVAVYPLHEPHLPCLSAMVNMATHGRCGDVVEASG